MPRLDLHNTRLVAVGVLWLAVMALIFTAALAYCRRTTNDAFVSVTTAARDSLLYHHVPHTQRVDYLGFTSYFDAELHLPRCVTYELTQQHLDGTAMRDDIFMADTAVDGCPPPDAYRGTGLHRGHMAPAADMRWSEQAVQQSFLMTNICPQRSALNEGGWGNLEQKCREWVARDHALIVACGPIIEPGLDTIGDTGIPIPQRYYKIILAHCVSPKRALAFIYPNDPTSGGELRRYVTTIRQVEQLTGINFFALLDAHEQEEFETVSNLQLWLH